MEPNNSSVPVAPSPSAIPNQQNTNVAQNQNTNPNTIKLAGAAYRASAYIIDSLIILIIALLIALVFSFILNPKLNATSLESDPNVIVFGLFYLIFSICYYAIFNVIKKAPPGKKLYGIEVSLMNPADKLKYPKSFIRETIKLVIPLIPLIGWILDLINFLIIVFSKSKQGFHDRAAKTQVIIVGKPISLWKQVLLYLVLLFVTMILAVTILSRSAPNVTNKEGASNFMIFAWQTEFIKDCQRFGVGDEKLCSCVGENLTNKYKTTDELYDISMKWEIRSHSSENPPNQMQEAILQCKNN